MNTSTSELYSVSVVIPANDAEKYIARAIESVLSQTRGADEIIVVDDGSTDDTAGEVQRYKGKVRYLRQENQGVFTACNTGIKSARGEWIGFLDAEDEWLPEKLKVQMAHLRRNPQLVWTHGDFYRHISQENRPGPVRDASKVELLLGGKEYFDSYFWAFLTGFYAWAGTLIVKRRVLVERGLFRGGQSGANDTDMWFRIAYRWPQIGYTNQPLAINHIDKSKEITKAPNQLKDYSDLVERHLKLASQEGCSEQFRPCAVRMLETLIRRMVKQHRGAEALAVLERFEDLLDRRFIKETRFRTRWPRAAWACLGVSSFMNKILRPDRQKVQRGEI